MYSIWVFAQQYRRKWKVNLIDITSIKKTCRGVLACKSAQCKFLMRPTIKVSDNIKMKCAISSCGADMVHIECTACVKFDIAENGTRVIYRHLGIHNHLPPPVAKADHYSLIKLKAKIEKEPDRRPKSFIVGREVDESIGNINHSFYNLDRVAYLRRKFLETVNFGNADLLTQFYFLQKKLDHLYQEPFHIVQSVSLSSSNQHISVATPFMLETLRSATTLGILTDATFDYFNGGSYLLSSSVFCEANQRWVPVLFSYTRGLDEEHHVPHFVVLIRHICQHVEGEREQAERLCQVVDFSKAQKNAFITAYIKLFRNDHIKNYSEESLREKANNMIKGCSFHFFQSVERISKNGSIIPNYDRERFKQSCDILKATDNPVTYNSIVEEMKSRYPKAKAWIAWFTNDSIATMIFPACSGMDQNLFNSLPSTTNGQESLHKLFKSIGGKHNEIVNGLYKLLLIAESMRKDVELLETGITIRYGTTRSGKEAKKQPKRKYENDGRAPDSTAKLIKLKRGRKPGGTNSVTDPLISYVSHENQNNCCFMDTVLNSLFSLYLGNPELDLLISTANSSILGNLLAIYRQNQHRSNTMLKKEMKLLSEWVVKEGIAKSGEQGPPVTVWSRMLEEFHEICDFKKVDNQASLLFRFVAEKHSTTGSRRVKAVSVSMFELGYRYEQVSLDDKENDSWVN